MTPTLDELIRRARTLMEEIHNHAFLIAELLYQANDKYKVKVPEIAKMVGCSRSTVYYLLEARTVRRELSLTVKQAGRTGWTKLAQVRPLMSDNDRTQILSLCADLSVNELLAYIRDGETARLKPKMFLLNTAQGQKLEKVLIKYGAVKTKSGLANKEAALMKLLSTIKLQK